MFDVSFVTDALRDIVTAAIASSPVFGGGPPPFTLGVSSQHPQDAAASPSADCDLNLYLFHLVEDRYVRNQFWTQQSITGQPPGPPRQPVAFEPLCLDLYYLLSAHSQHSYAHEQQAMSVAMRAFHENAVVKLATPSPTGAPQSEITIELESLTGRRAQPAVAGAGLPVAAGRPVQGVRRHARARDRADVETGQCCGGRWWRFRRPAATAPTRICSERCGRSPSRRRRGRRAMTRRRPRAPHRAGAGLRAARHRDRRRRRGLPRDRSSPTAPRPSRTSAPGRCR